MTLGHEEAATPPGRLTDDQRAALVARLERGTMPQAMRERAQWLFWRLEKVEGRERLQKVPYYVNGRKRYGELGGPSDRRQLVSLEAALTRFRAGADFTGIGFAFLEGDGLVGIDLDWKDEPDGQPLPHHEQAMEACDSFTELSPSGKGVHVICLGQTDSFKDDSVGVEVYCGGRYFTCTGDRLDSKPFEALPLKPYALAYLRQVVQEARDRAKAARQAQASDPAEAPPTAPAPVAPGQAGNEFRQVNDAALAALGKWVPELLPGAKSWRDGYGYRVTSKALGRDLQEDLQLTPAGIMDFGEEQGMSPIDVVMKWGAGLSTPKDALHWLAGRLGISLPEPVRRHRHLQVVPRAETAGDGPAGDGRPEPPPAPPPGEEAPAVRDEAWPAKNGGTKPPGRRRAPRAGEGEGGATLDCLLEHYALIRGTDTVWDGEARTIMQVKNLRLLKGAGWVNMWLAHPERRLLMPEQIKFEPGVELPEGDVNLFDGLPTEPVECSEQDVRPMLDLLHHLCKVSARTPEQVEAIKRQVLCWCALMVQQPGAKMRFALVLHGPQGTGKNMFCDVLRRILGKYGKMVGQTELDDRFNGYMSGKLLLIGNEVVTRAELFHQKNKLKWVITEEEIPIRGMHQEVRWESNHANLIFLSNELMPVALEWDDRRHLVIYTPAADDPDLYLRVLDFLDRDGHGKWLHYLLHVDLEDFNEHTKPLMTEAKEALIELGLRPAERFAAEWLDGMLDLPVQVCSAEQLFGVYVRWCRENGERDWRGQAMFTRTVERFVRERVKLDERGKRRPPALVYKQIALRNPDHGKRTTVRCWVPQGCDAPHGISEGEWAWSAVESFGRTAAAFGRAAQGDGDGEA